MKILKKIFLILFLQNSILLVAQKQEFVFLDKVTKIPIESVNIFYPDINEGTISNAEGKASIKINNSDLKISHINYDEIITNLTTQKIKDTIFLNPKSYQLDEVVIKSFNLKKAIKNVLDNYNELYVDIPFEKECVLKETLKINDIFKRLILTKVNWWGKSYKVKYTSDLKLRLAEIDFNRNEAMDIFYDVPRLNVPSNSGYIEPSSLINTLYLNTFLTTVKDFTENAKIKVENSPTDQIIVSFETDWKSNTKFQYRQTGIIVFEINSKAIISLTFNNEYKNNVVKGVIKENRKESISDTKTTSIKLNFYNSLNGKYSLKSIDILANLEITYDNKIHNALFLNSIYVLKETPTKKVDNEGLIDLSKPIFENLPSKTISNNNSILLTEEEKKFIFKTK